jgi:hypothetical protein
VSPKPPARSGLALVIDIRKYEGTEPMRAIDPDLKVLRSLGPAAWVETPRPDRWGYSLNGRYVPGVADERVRHGIRVFPAATLTDAKQQINTWMWSDQAALDA